MLDLHNAAMLVVAVVALLSTLYAVFHNPSRKPPSVPSKVPFVGHFIGPIRHGPGYLGMLCEKHRNHTIFAVNVFSKKLFVTSSPAIMRAAQKHPTIITLEPLFELAQKRVCQTPGDSLGRLCDQSCGPSPLSRIAHHTTPVLAGKYLDRMNEIMLRGLLAIVNDMDNDGTVDLNAWLRHAVTIASINATYGTLNPFKRRHIEDTFWELQRNMSLLLANIVPWLIAPKAWNARKDLCAALKNYFDLGGHEDGSELIAMRYSSFLGAGLTHEEIAYSEIPLVAGLLTNTVPAAFWVHFELLSRPKLLG